MFSALAQHELSTRVQISDNPIGKGVSIYKTQKLENAWQNTFTHKLTVTSGSFKLLFPKEITEKIRLENSIKSRKISISPILAN